MLVNICKDIDTIKKQFGQYSLSKIDDSLKGIPSEDINDVKELEKNIDNLNGLLKSMEEINTDLISNKKLLKNVLDEDQEIKKKFVEKIKNTINAYVNFYDYVDDIRMSLEKEDSNIDISLLKVVNSILSFLEKEYSNIGLLVHIPNKGVDKFDSFKHESVLTEKNLRLPSETIVGVIKRGFYYNDRNIRYVRNAKVITVLN